MTDPADRRARAIPNTDLIAGDRIITQGGVTVVESDAEPSSSNPGMVCVDVPAGTLYLAADQSSLVHRDCGPGDGGELSAEYLAVAGYPDRDVELFTLGLALGKGRALGAPDAATIADYCLADPDDRERLADYLGVDDAQLQPTAATALHFVASYGDGLL